MFKLTTRLLLLHWTVCTNATTDNARPNTAQKLRKFTHWKLKLLTGTAQRYMASKEFSKYPKSVPSHQKLELDKSTKRSKSLPGRPEEDRHFYRPPVPSHALICLPLDDFAWNQHSSKVRHFLRTIISHRSFRCRENWLFRSGKPHSTKTLDHH